MGNWDQNCQIWETETVTLSKIGYQTGMEKSAGDSRSGADLTIEHRSKMVIQRQGQLTTNFEDIIHTSLKNVFVHCWWSTGMEKWQVLGTLRYPLIL